MTSLAASPPLLLPRSRFHLRSDVCFRAQLHLRPWSLRLVGAAFAGVGGAPGAELGLSLDVLRDVRVGAIVREGWNCGERPALPSDSEADEEEHEQEEEEEEKDARFDAAAPATRTPPARSAVGRASFEPYLSEARLEMLQHQSCVELEQDTELLPPPMAPSSIPAASSFLGGMGGRRASLLLGDPAAAARAKLFSTPAASSSSSTAAAAHLLAAARRNPLHQRIQLTATLPPPDAVSNTTSTSHFTLLLYVCMPPTEVAADSTSASPRTYRFAASVRVWAKAEDQLLAPHPGHAPASTAQ